MTGENDTNGSSSEHETTRPEGVGSDELSPTLGPYRLLERCGHGGMGEVWAAEQTEPVRRKVAVKIIKRGMDTRQVVGRFEAERQALAVMDHSSIAKVFDAGETPDGRPYFVMEFVDGEPITQHCDRHRLTTVERLRLFQEVCAAVQHAHHRAIIHRDLKPSNVLVTTEEGRGVPKIIDFGVAKATAQPLTERRVHTAVGVLIGTPEYMSPEQADMGGHNVDTRTDVYSLGVILYELLVGALPFDSRREREAGLEEVFRRIREDDPPRPSTRVSTMGDASTPVARARRTEPTRLISQLRGDLDWITMKALEKDRSRRYGSPAELAADIDRHLNDRPVVASPPSTPYRARKFLRRHKLGASVVAVLVVMLLVLVGATTFQARRVAREAETARYVSEFLQGLFRLSDPNEALGRDITARELLDQGARRIDTELADRPEVQARLMATIGDVYRELGMHGEAGTLLDRSLKRREALLGRGHPDTLASLHDLGQLRWDEGRYDEAEALHREALDARRRTLGDRHPDTLQSQSALATAYQGQGRFADAETLHRETLETRRSVLGRDDPDTLRSMGNLALACKSQRRYDEAEALYREMLELGRVVLGETHPDTLKTMNNLATVYRRQQRYDEAEVLYRDTLDACRRVLGETHPDTLMTMNNLANLFRNRRRYNEAETLHRQALAASREVLGPSHPATLRSMANLAVLYMSARRNAEAEALMLETLEGQRRVLGNEHPETIRTLVNCGLAHGRLGRLAEAEALLLEAVETIPRALGPRHPWLEWAASSLVSLYKETEELEKARPHVERLLDGYREAADAEDASAAAKNEYAWQLLIVEPTDLRQPDVAVQYALRACLMTDLADPGFLDTLALAYHRTGETSKAVDTQRKALELLAPDHRKRPAYQARLDEYENAFANAER